MGNLIKAVKNNLGLRRGKLLFGFEGDNYRQLPWGALDDVVMGGVSESTFQIDPSGSENGGPTGVFKGLIVAADDVREETKRLRGVAILMDPGLIGMKSSTRLCSL